MANEICKHTPLFHVLFVGNNIGDAGAAAFAEVLKRNTTLKILYLECTFSFTFKRMYDVPDTHDVHGLRNPIKKHGLALSWRRVNNTVFISLTRSAF